MLVFTATLEICEGQENSPRLEARLPNDTDARTKVKDMTETSNTLRQLEIEAIEQAIRFGHASMVGGDLVVRVGDRVYRLTPIDAEETLH
jgi:hypothetical protein